MRRLSDSYDHYRQKVGCGVLEAIWRTFAYEVLQWPDGVRPKTWNRWRGSK